MKEIVFINCPFSKDYEEYFHALVFTIYFCEFTPCCSLERTDSSENRLEKIIKLIRKSKYSIHDISYVHLDKETKLPRFNMPFEVGLFLGAKQFGSSFQKKKQCLIMDIKPYRYKTFFSDISGQDIENYKGDVVKLIKIVRDWLREKSKKKLPGPKTVEKGYLDFLQFLKVTCEETGYDPEDLTFLDLQQMILDWLKLSK